MGKPRVVTGGKLALVDVAYLVLWVASGLRTRETTHSWTKRGLRVCHLRRVFPLTAMMGPLFDVMGHVGLLNTYLGLSVSDLV
jgi:ABC-type glycerol-3-phosphate transport system permease component